MERIESMSSDPIEVLLLGCMVLTSVITEVGVLTPRVGPEPPLRTEVEHQKKTMAATPLQSDE